MGVNVYGVDCTGWDMVHPKATPDMLGIVPLFISGTDPRPAREQFNENYQYGGWSPIHGFTKADGDSIKYPGDPVFRPLAQYKLRDERVVMYQSAIFAIFQPDGTFEVARMD